MSSLFAFMKILRNDCVLYPQEGVRGVAGVASATPYFGHIKIGSNKKIKLRKNLTFLYL